MKIIGHLDMDAFFAAVEERDHPRLKGKPVVVGADPLGGKGRGVVSTANYAAREYGIRSAMPITKAWRLSEEARQAGQPPAVFMEPNFASYRKSSEKIINILRNYSEAIEEASIDEAYFDLGSSRSFKEARDIAVAIKADILKHEKLTASIGLGPNKMVAKIASDMDKPDGLTVVGEEGEAECGRLVRDFLAPLPLRKLPGIGPKTEDVLLHKGLRTVADVRGLSEDELRAMFGKFGGELYQKARGLASNVLAGAVAQRSIGEERTFDEDTLEPALVVRCLEEISLDLGLRLKGSGFNNFRTVVLKVRFSDFETLTRSHTFEGPLSDARAVGPRSLQMLMPFLDSRENPRRKKIRLLGLRLEKLG